MRPFNKTTATLVRPHPFSTLCPTPIGNSPVWPDLTLASPRPCGPQLRSSDTARGLKADSGGGCSLHSSSVAHSCRPQDPGYVSCLLTAYAYIIRRKARMVKSCTGDSKHSK